MNFKKHFCLLLVPILSIGLLIGCNKTNEETELLVSAAASLTDVLNEIGEAYKEVKPEIKLNFTFGSSGALQAQIEEGAPVDVFISAAEKQMDALEKGEHIVEDTRKTLLINEVVLIVPSNSELEIESFDDLRKDNIKKIAVGDPSNVPVGQYSEEIFTNLNLLDDINPKTIYGNDVRTVLTWVENEEVDCGLVYATDTFITDKVKIIAESPEGSHKKVSYPVAAINSTKLLEDSKDFIEFLSTEEAGEIFKKYGFKLN